MKREEAITRLVDAVPAVFPGSRATRDNVSVYIWHPDGSLTVLIVIESVANRKASDLLTQLDADLEAGK